MKSRARRRYRLHRAIERFAGRLSEWYVIEVPRRWQAFIAWYRLPWQDHEHVERQMNYKRPPFPSEIKRK